MGALRTIMELTASTSTSKTNDNDNAVDRCSELFIQCIVYHILSMDDAAPHQKDQNGLSPDELISFDLFLKYAQCLHSAEDVVGCFVRSQSEFSSLQQTAIESVEALSSALRRVRVFAPLNSVCCLFLHSASAPSPDPFVFVHTLLCSLSNALSVCLCHPWSCYHLLGHSLCSVIGRGYKHHHGMNQSLSLSL